MIILFYINSIHHGGAQRVMINLADYLSANNFDCVLITSYLDDWEYPVPKKVKRLSIYSDKKEMGNFIAKNFSLVKKLRNIVKNENADILVSFMGEPNIRSILACFGLKTKNIISIRNDPKKEYPNIFMSFLAKVLFNKADGIVFQTKDEQEYFSKRIQKKSKIILNTVDTVFFNTKLSRKRKDIVTTGRLTKQKNHELLIRAFAEIANDIEDNLFIYGDGELKDYLQDLINELHMNNRVFLPGPTHDVVNVLKDKKLFVLSSDFEGMPNSLMEAMAMGLPCISTDCPCGGPKSIINNMHNGVLTKVGDVKELENSIYNLIVDEDKRKSIEDNAKITSKKLFVSEIINEEWKKYIENIQ